VLSSRKGDELDSLAGSLPGDRHRYVVSDLADAGAAGALVAEAGAVDILVANAGLASHGRVEDYTPEQVSKAIRVNLEAPIEMTRALIPGLRERGSGQIVLISSLNAKAATPRTAIYAATKFGLRGFGLSLRDELWGSGIGVSVVMPGFVRDAGIFHKSGAKPPAGLGTATPAAVGAAVAFAIERNRGEVEVAPFLQRRAAGFAHHLPGLASRLSRGRADKIAERIAGGGAAER
jgi:short-subunit dehydrogenase